MLLRKAEGIVFSEGMVPRFSARIIVRFCERGMASEVESLLAEMTSPDVATFITLIDAYIRAGRVDDDVRNFNKMIDVCLHKLAIHHAH